MTYPAIELDFARRGPRFTARGLLLLTIGLVAAVFVFVDYRSVAAQSAGLEWRLAALHGDRPAKIDKNAQRAEQDAAAAISDLTTPWSSLLRELELASADSDGTVAVLGIEPDRDKHEVRVLAESRTLPIALAYVERLQKSEALRFPMLESHQVQLKDPQHPVRFEIKAGWVGPP
jgi:DMSO/TMAO reductase YedYZ molybdopterin-dependent catalytic subunit